MKPVKTLFATAALSLAAVGATTTYSPGSTVSHYTTEAKPNQLMEPAINTDLTHEVTPPRDLTYPLLRHRVVIGRERTGPFPFNRTA